MKTNTQTTKANRKDRLCFILVCILLHLPSFAAPQTPFSDECDNIITFSKLYGLARWFVPVIPDNEINWNQFAVNGVESVRKCTTQKELVDTLNSLFRPIIPYFLIDTDSIGRKLSNIESDYDTNRLVVWQHLGGELSHQSTLYHSKITNVPSRNLNVGRQAVNYYFDPRSIVSDTLNLQITARKENATKDFSAYAIFDFDDSSPENHYVNLLDRGKQKKMELHDTDSTYTFQYVIDRQNPSLNVDWSVYPDGDGSLILSSVEMTDQSGFPVYSIDIINGVGFWTNPDLYEYQFRTDGLVIREKQQLWPQNIAEAPKHFNYRIPNSNYYVHIPLVLPDDKAFIPTYFGDVPHQADKMNVRLADYLVAYNILYFFSPLFGLTEKEPELLLTSGLKKILMGENTGNALKHLLSVMIDGHVSLDFYNSDSIYQISEMESFFPAVTSERNGLLTVIHSFTDSLKAGDSILSINGFCTDEALKSFCISGSKQLKNAYLEMFAFPIRKESILKVLRNGDSVTTTITGIDYYEYEELLHRYYNERPSEHICDNIYYVNLADITLGEVDSLLSTRNESDIVIFDARHGASNFILRDISPFLCKIEMAEKRYSEAWKPHISYPERCIPPRDFVIDAPMSSEVFENDIILIGPCLMSSNEDFLDMVKYYGIATLIGTPTAGISGSINGASLPSGVELCFTGERAYSLSGMTEDFLFNGIKPHKEISITDEDILTETDTQFKLLFEMLIKKKATEKCYQ